MNKFGIQIERINFSIAFYEQNFLNITWRFCIFASLFNVVFMDIFYYNTKTYREILLQFLQFTEKYYVNRMPFHFRHRAEAVLRRAARLSKAFSTARPSMPKKWFYTSI